MSISKKKNLRKRKRKFKDNRTSASHEEIKLFDIKLYKYTEQKYETKMSLELRNLRKSNCKEYWKNFK